jgi:hypothetical protein
MDVVSGKPRHGPKHLKPIDTNNHTPSFEWGEQTLAVMFNSPLDSSSSSAKQIPLLTPSTPTVPLVLSAIPSQGAQKMPPFEEEQNRTLTPSSEIESPLSGEHAVAKMPDIDRDESDKENILDEALLNGVSNLVTKITRSTSSPQSDEQPLASMRSHTFPDLKLLATKAENKFIEVPQRRHRLSDIDSCSAPYSSRKAMATMELLLSESQYISDLKDLVHVLSIFFKFPLVNHCLY